MAFHTEKEHTGDGSTTDFSITFPFLEPTDVKVRTKASGATDYTDRPETDYTITGATLTFIANTPANTESIVIYRNTNIDKSNVVFQAGSSLRSQDLNNLSNQFLYSIQENEHEGVALTLPAGSPGSPYPVSRNDITLSTEISWIISDDAVTASKIAPDAIDSEHYIDLSIDTQHIANDQVTYAKIQDITTANRVLGRASAGEVQEVQVATAMIADDAVTYAKMQDIGTANRVLGRASTGEVQEVQVATAMIADDAVTLAKLAPDVGHVPIGTVIWYAGSAPPKGYLKANGDTIQNGNTSISGNDSDGDAIGTVNTAALFAITGATLPDLRGEFIRGFDDGKGTDSGRTIRSAQTESYIAHSHLFAADQQIGDGADYTDDSSTSHDYSRVGSSYSVDADSQTGGDPSYNYRTLTDDLQTNEPGTETRPRNIALLACIKY